jgi:hypothetical protein
MLIIYARTGVAGVEKLTQLDEGRERDARFGGEPDARTGHGVEHPGGDLQRANRLGVEPAITSRNPLTLSLSEDVNLPTVPGVKRVTDLPDIDQWGLVSPSCTISRGRTNPAATCLFPTPTRASREYCNSHPAK